MGELSLLPNIGPEVEPPHIARLPPRRNGYFAAILQ